MGRRIAVHHYVIRVEGTLPSGTIDAFPALKVSHQTEQTVLHGDLPDQAALTGLLDLLKRRNVEVVEVLSVPTPAGTSTD